MPRGTGALGASLPLSSFPPGATDLEQRAPLVPDTGSEPLYLRVGSCPPGHLEKAASSRFSWKDPCLSQGWKLPSFTERDFLRCRKTSATSRQEKLIQRVHVAPFYHLCLKPSHTRPCFYFSFFLWKWKIRHWPRVIFRETKAH